MKSQKYINEKFTEDSDPIQDLGIGIYVKRHFNSYEEMYDWFYEFAPYICKVKNCVELLNTNPDKSDILENKYWRILNEFYKKYITINDWSAGAPFESGPFRDLIKQRRKIKESYDLKFVSFKNWLND